MRTLESILTKIVATVGPSTTRQVLPKLVDAGASVFRLNFSHGTLEEHEQMLRNIREVEGIVVGDFDGTNQLNGFFLQEEDNNRCPSYCCITANGCP